MKNFFRFAGQSLLAGLFAAFLLAAVITPIAVAQIQNHIQTPARFTDYTGTNGLVIDSALYAPPVVWRGTNSFTGMSTTNREFLGGTGVTNTFVIRNGIIVDIE